MASPPSAPAPLRTASEKGWFVPYLRSESSRLAIGIGLVCLTNVFQLSLPYLSKRAIDALQASEGSHVRWLAYVIAAVALTQAVIRVFSRMYLLDAGRQVEFHLRGDLFKHLTRMTPSFYGRVGVGDVMSRCVNDLGQIRLLIGPGLLMLVNALAAYAVALPAMLGLDPLLTACALAPYLPLLFLLQRQAKQVFVGMRAVQDELGVLSVRIQENLAGQLSVKSFGREATEQAAFAQRNDAYLGANLGLARARATLQLLFGAIGGLGAVAVLGVGGYAVIHGRLTLGGYTAFSGYLAELSMRSSMLGFFLAGWQRGRASLERVREVMQEPPEFVDAAPHAHRQLQGDIEISNLTIRYGERRVLDGVSLRIARGRSLAIVGKTGAGKTTLLSALARLVDVPPGAVRYDGLDLRDWPLADLRRQLGLVPQEPFLFSATLGQNIALGQPEAPLAAIEAAAETARLTADLRALPEGLETEVGERGVTLSGGQRSRAALARAVLVKPKVLLLDDPFANVDADTARALWEEIEIRGAAPAAPLRGPLVGEIRGAAPAAPLRGPLVGERPETEEARPTRILVTHRLALAMACDEIAVLEDGKLVERGSHEDLLALGGSYSRLFVREQILEQLKEVG